MSSLAMLFAAQAAHASGASDEYCRQFYAKLMNGSSSPSYAWSAEHTRGVKPAAPLSEDPELVTTFGYKRTEGQALIEAGPPPGVEAFRAQFPHDLDDLASSQTVLRMDGREFLLKSYDPKTGQVILETEVLKVLKGSARLIGEGIGDKVTVDQVMKESSPTISIWGTPYHVDRAASSPERLELFKWEGYSSRYRVSKSVPIKTSEDLFFPGLDLSMSQLRIGQILVSPQGKKFEVRSLGEHGQGKVVLRRVERIELSWEEFSALSADEKRRVSSLPTVPPLLKTEAVSPSRWGLLGKIFGGTKDTEPRVKLLGPDGFRRVGSEERLLEDFTASKKEVNMRTLLQEILGGKFPKGTRIEALVDGQKRILVIGERDTTWSRSSLESLLNSEYGVDPLYKLEQLRIESPGQNIPRIYKKEYVFDSAGESHLNFYDISPVMGVDLSYVVEAAGGPVQVQFRFPKPTEGILEERRLEKMADTLMAHLPAAQADAAGLVLLDNGTYYLKPAAGLASDGVVEGSSVRSITLLKHSVTGSAEDRLKVYWHELGHMIAQKLWNNHHVPGAEWTRAVAVDGKFVSGYALHQSPGGPRMPDRDFVEDIAETVAAYIATDGGRLQPELRKAFAARFSLLDRVFAVPEQQEAIRAASAAVARRNHLNLMPVSLGTGTTALYVFSTDRETPQ